VFDVSIKPGAGQSDMLTPLWTGIYVTHNGWSECGGILNT
jgi:hypothetical protein